MLLGAYIVNWFNKTSAVNWLTYRQSSATTQGQYTCKVNWSNIEHPFDQLTSGVFQLQEMFMIMSLTAWTTSSSTTRPVDRSGTYIP